MGSEGRRTGTDETIPFSFKAAIPGNFSLFISPRTSCGIALPATFRDRATYDRPHQYATGVRYLFVNGRLAIDGGKYTGVLAGKVLRHQDRAEEK